MYIAARLQPRGVLNSILFLWVPEMLTTRLVVLGGIGRSPGTTAFSMWLLKAWLFGCKTWLPTPNERHYTLLCLLLISLRVALLLFCLWHARQTFSNSSLLL